MERKKFAEALEEYKAALRLEPLSAAVWSNQGSVLYQMGDIKSAIASYKRAL